MPSSRHDTGGKINRRRGFRSTSHERDSNNAVVDAAIAKAKGAALYRRPTKLFEDRLKDAPFLTGLDGISVVGGGIPLVELGHVVGDIGASGAPTSPGDIQSAQAGVDAVK